LTIFKDLVGLGLKIVLRRSRSWFSAFYQTRDIICQYKVKSRNKFIIYSMLSLIVL